MLPSQGSVDLNILRWVQCAATLGATKLINTVTELLLRFKNEGAFILHSTLQSDIKYYSQTKCTAVKKYSVLGSLIFCLDVSSESVHK